MSTKKKFTPEEQEQLRANEYTARVTEDTISYTLAFKEAFWQLSLEGFTSTAAFRKLGYDPEVLGFERIHNSTKRIRRAAQTPEGLRGGGGKGMRRKKGGLQGADLSSMDPAEAAKRMQHEIVYLQQQMAFLKKVMKLSGGQDG